MNPVTWAFGFTILARLISSYKKAKTGEPSRIDISGGEFSKFIITYFFMYIWFCFWISIIQMA